MKQNYKKRGFSLLEVVVASSILLSTMLGIMAAYSTYVRSTLSNTEKLQATFLLEEGVEIIRLLRDEGWGTSFGAFATSTTYALQQGPSSWSVVSGIEYIDGIFERSFEVFPVFRDSSDDISISGTQDNFTKKVIFDVSWLGPLGTTTKQMSVYFSDIF